MGYTSIYWMQIREEAVDSDGDQLIREEATNPFNESVEETKNRSLARRPCHSFKNGSRSLVVLCANSLRGNQGFESYTAYRRSLFTVEGNGKPPYKVLFS